MNVYINHGSCKSNCSEYIEQFLYKQQETQKNQIKIIRCYNKNLHWSPAEQLYVYASPYVCLFVCGHGLKYSVGSALDQKHSHNICIHWSQTYDSKSTNRKYICLLSLINEIFLRSKYVLHTYTHRDKRTYIDFCILTSLVRFFLVWLFVEQLFTDSLVKNTIDIVINNVYNHSLLLTLHIRQNIFKNVLFYYYLGNIHKERNGGGQTSRLIFLKLFF